MSTVSTEAAEVHAGGECRGGSEIHIHGTDVRLPRPRPANQATAARRRVRTVYWVPSSITADAYTKLETCPCRINFFKYTIYFLWINNFVKKIEGK